MVGRFLLLVALLAGCSESVEFEARATYNKGLAALQAGQFEDAKKHLLASRDRSGPDDVLRFQAAYNLGLVYAGEAEAAEKPEDALDLYRQAAAWFRDAARLSETDEDTRVNLTFVLNKVRALADELNKKNKTLEVKLDRLIEDMRALREQMRAVLEQLREEGVERAPVAFQDAFTAMATQSRVLLADAGTVSSLVGDELAGLRDGQGEQQSQEDRVRLAQLEAMEPHLLAARQALLETRRELRRLAAKRAHERSDASLASFKRAREQLLSPPEVLGILTQEQAQLLAMTDALKAARDAEKSLAAEGQPALPKWLSPEQLAVDQGRVTERTQEILARFEAFLAAPPEDGASPDAASTREAVEGATPPLKEAVSAMTDAEAALLSDFALARKKEQTAVEQLLAALERFAGEKQLINLALRDQMGAVALLTQETLPGQKPLGEKERGAALGEAERNNTQRLQRLETLFSRKLAALENPQPGPDGQAPSPEQTEQEKQRYSQADTLRASALAALKEQSAAQGAAKREPAERTVAELKELQKLFFSIIEHLKELARAQGETHDKTSSMAASAEFDRPGAVSSLAGTQSEHLQLAEAILSALSEQADAGQGGDEQAAKQAERLREAAEEVAQARDRMSDASANLSDAAEQVGQMSVPLDPALEAQPAAIEHLENAIRILQPPQQDQNKDQQQEQQEQQQEQQQKEDMSKQQAKRALQEIRDREADRRRKKRKASPQPVEKDW